jgi:DNA-directed RNA polymerase specialized sigma24 family protein
MQFAQTTSAVALFTRLDSFLETELRKRRVDCHLAADIKQDILLYLWRSRAQFAAQVAMQQEAALEALLRQTIRNRLASHFRRINKRHARAQFCEADLDALAAPQSSSGECNLAAVIDQARAFDIPALTIAIQRLLENVPVAVLARRFGVAEGTISKRFMRGARGLRFIIESANDARHVTREDVLSEMGI